MIRRRIESARNDYGTFVNLFDSKTKKIVRRIEKIKKGCGFNVSNSKPTLCINDLIQQHNIDQRTELEQLDKDQLIARTVTIIEELVNRFNDEGHEDFQKLYYKYWIHSGAKVKLESENNIEVEVVSLDENGYLQVRAANGRLISVHPDGNRFDFMKNLIALKK